MATTTTAKLSLTRRPRRLRRTEAIRSLVRETRLTPDCFIYPLFVVEGAGVRREVPSMPGVFQISVDQAVQEAAAAKADGVPAVLLFGLPAEKDASGSGASDPDAPVQTAIRALKREVKDLIVITDVCLCEYTSHGHCGIVEGEDIVAPSDMMDGRVAAIRRTLDERGYEQTAIMSYAAKYCSGFYGPFREAADSTPQFGDRRSHQLDPANVDEAMREVEIDIAEGADIVMVKPALPYLDILAKVKERFAQPTAAYQVSGEYSMLKAAARNGWLDERRVMFETLIGIRRAGADMIITYYAREAARSL
jgi:porphobilinogen synthase